MRTAALTISHMARYSSDEDDYDVHYILRFTCSDQDEWSEMKDRLTRFSRTYGRSAVRWTPTYQWPDGKRGGWIVEDFIVDNHLEIYFWNISSKRDTADSRYYEKEWKEYSHSQQQQQSDHTEPGKRQKTALPANDPMHVVLSIFELEAMPTIEQEAKSAYTKLAKRFHPDVNRTRAATDTMKIVNLAYEVLKAHLN